jgi:kynurenine 3-monooxygenase
VTAPVRIVGAGPTGSFLAILLQRRGFRVELYESRADPRAGPEETGRSINLALADRGIHALQLAGIFEDVKKFLLPMRGRLIHHPDGGTSLQPYGQRPNEQIYSVSRHRLNQALIELAARLPGVTLHFEHRLEGVDFAESTVTLHDKRRGQLLHLPMQPLLATDGAGSLTRRHMQQAGLIEAHEVDLEHGYKELSIPADTAGDWRMERAALHIWPRGNYMLIALPNEDGSFTATVFLPKRGVVSFEALTETAAIERFLSQNFPDVYPFMPDCVREFRDHPVGFLGTVSAAPWAHSGAAGLVGDAAHAIVPFHGQGMNCCLEDCLELDACVGRQSSWESTLAEFFTRRKPNADAIAAMSLDNYSEMRERVIDPRFQLQQILALELETRHPRQFIPRYSMVMFHHEIPYQTALQRGAVQAQILEDLTSNSQTRIEDIDFERAARAINGSLAPIPTMTE